MKKVLISIAAMLACVGMNAQFIAGGSLELSTESFEQKDADNENIFKISPLVGYQLNDKLIVGASATLGIERGFEYWPDYKQTTFSISPFAMYELWNSDKISFYGKAAFTYYTSTVEYSQPMYNALGEPDGKKKESHKYSSFGLGLAPVLEFAMTDHLSLLSEFGYIGFDSYKDESSILSLSVSGALSFGLIYRF